MLRKIVATLLTNGFSQFVAVALFLLTAKNYGVSGRGIYAAVTSLGTFASSLFGLSIGMVLPHLVTAAGVPRDAFFKRSLASIVALVLILTCLTLVGVSVAYTIDPRILGRIPGVYLAAAGLSFPYFMWIGCNDLVFASAGEITQQNRIVLVNRCLLVITSGVLVGVIRVPLLGYLLVYGAFNLIQMGREIWFLFHRFDADLRIDTGLMKTIVRNGLTLHAVTIASLLNTTFSVLVVTYYSPDLRDVGYLNFVAQLTSMLVIVPIVVNRYLTAEITARGVKAVWPQQKRIMSYGILLTIGITIIAAVLIDPFCRLFKHEFLGAVTLFRLTLIAVVPSAFSIMMTSQWYSSGRFKLMSITTMAIGVMSAVSTLVAVPRLHEFGALITTLLTSAATLAVNLAFFVSLNRATASSDGTSAASVSMRVT